MKTIHKLSFGAMATALVISILAVPPISAGISLQTKAPINNTPVINGHYRALIIGNNDYQDPKKQWKSLKTAISDAHAIENLLRTQYGFSDIELLTNATRRDTLLALNKLSKRVLPNDSVLVYYAGHGFMDPETEKGYWIPTDAQGSDHTTFLRNSTIRDELSTIADRVKHTLLISDSCFSGTLLRSGNRGIQQVTGTKPYYNKVAKKKSVQILAAGGAEFVDDNYQKSGHSPFTYFLLNELKHNDNRLITASELSTSVEKAVANNVEQIPESGVLQGSGDELGEFIFLKLKVMVDGVPADKVKVSVEVVPTTQAESPQLSTIPQKIPKQSAQRAKAIKQPLPLKSSNIPLPTL